MKRTSPARAAAVDSDVLVPLSQALISSVVVGIAATGMAIAVHWPIYVVPIAAGGTFCVAWFVLLADHRSLLRVIERGVNTDLDRDGHVGRPEPPPPPTPLWAEPLEAEISYYDEKGLRKRMQYLDVIPGEVLRATRPEHIQDFARAALAGEPLTEADWTGQGRPFSLRKFRIMMQTLERSELVERVGKGSTATRSLTLAGRAVFRKMVE